MNLRIFDSVADMLAATARLIAQRASGREAVSIALSGGSTPVPLYEQLGRPPYRDILAQTAITWVVVDERYVPLDDPQSNAGMLQRTLFRDGIAPSHRFLRFMTEMNDPEATARQFEEDWRRLGLETVDLVLLGVGDDGHTASLFPGTPVLDVQDRIAAAVYVPRLSQWRVTITLPVIRSAGLRVVNAAGESKAKIVREVRDGVDHPVARATDGAIESWWLIDRAAARELTP